MVCKSVCLILLLGLTVSQAPKKVLPSGRPSKNKKEMLQRFVKEFVSITPGKGKFPKSFLMGSKNGNTSEQPAHRVTFEYPFSIAKYEVTQELYQAVMGKNPSRWKGPRNSVEKVSWDEANEFCRKVTAELHKAQLISQNDIIRLPSEAEWEYACRAGTKTAYSFGDSEKDLGDYCWFTGNAKGNDPPVGAKKPNPWGLCDMHGYIWEWCADTWRPNYKTAPADGSAVTSKAAKTRVLRGGAWTEKADRCRSATRHHVPVDTRTPAIGFRCVKVRTKK